MRPVSFNQSELTAVLNGLTFHLTQRLGVKTPYRGDDFAPSSEMFLLSGPQTEHRHKSAPNKAFRLSAGDSVKSVYACLTIIIMQFNLETAVAELAR